jgi:LacI family transcriptional regulator
MKSKRPTMKDVAARAGVHQTTVSLALRNHPSIPQKTRDRIKKVADEMGYRPDPMLASLIAYRKGGSKRIQAPTIAYIMNVDGEEGLKASFPRQMFLEGAKRKAAELGYNIDVFYYGGRHYHSKYLDKVLTTRNINGIILAGFYTHFTDIELSWDRYSIVKIEMLPTHVRTHTIENNQYQVVRRAFQELRKLGFRRIGLCVADHDEIHTRNLFSAGYLVEQNLIPESDRVPLLIFKGNEFYEEFSGSRSTIHNWIVDNQLDICISNWRSIDTVVAEAQKQIDHKVYNLSLDLDPTAEGAWGIIQNHEIVGASAVEVLSGLMQHHQKGLAEFPRINLINSSWKAPELDTIEAIRADQIFASERVKI